MTTLQEQFEKDSAKYCEFIPVVNFNSVIHISLKYNYLYVETPKVACSSIKKTLQKIELNDPDFHNLHNREYSPLLKPSQVKNLDRFINHHQPFKFCFVRNPYTRLLSAYLDKIKKETPIQKNFLDSIAIHHGKKLEQVDFSYFVEVVCGQRPRQMDQHWRTQYYQTLNNQISYDFIGKFENFDEDFLTVLRKIDSKAETFISHWKRHATNANESLADYYNPDLIKKVKEKFAIDFEFFGYDPEDISI